MEVGMKVIIGGKHARDCLYKQAVGLKGTVKSFGIRQDPYHMKGRHTMCFVDAVIKEEEPWSCRQWFVHIEDCLPLDNKSAKHLLMRLED